MPIPDLIEIVPIGQPVQAEITVPGSKSITNRALILAALGEGQTTITGALWSEDTQVMAEALKKLGFEVEVDLDPLEFCNRTITLQGQGGRIPKAGTADKPLEIFVGNAGTAARFLSALVCLGPGFYRLNGVPRMQERPQAALFSALRELGYSVEAEQNNDRLPVRIRGQAPAGESRNCSVSIESSSQFASALLLSASVGGWKVKVLGEDSEESPYVAMTTELIKSFPKRGGTFQIEPDASSGSYFVAAGRLLSGSSLVSVNGWPSSGWQMDARFPGVLERSSVLDSGLKNETSTRTGAGERRAKPIADVLEISRSRDLGDSIMTAIVLAPFALEPVRFTDLGRLRVQECERVAALRTELSKCGAKVVEQGDSLTIYPSELHGAEIETYNDHRMAMCFAVLGVKVSGIKIREPACVKKTFPNFFQKWATPPTQGLGATILDGRSRRKLALAELFAD